MGPIVISLVYEKVGIYASTGIVCGLLTMALVISSVAYKRLVPLEEQPNQNDLHWDWVLFWITVGIVEIVNGKYNRMLSIVVGMVLL